MPRFSVDFALPTAIDLGKLIEQSNLQLVIPGWKKKDPPTPVEQGLHLQQCLRDDVRRSVRVFAAKCLIVLKQHHIADVAPDLADACEKLEDAIANLHALIVAEHQRDKEVQETNGRVLENP